MSRHWIGGLILGVCAGALVATAAYAQRGRQPDDGLRRDGDGVPETQWEPTRPPENPRDLTGLWEMPRIGVALRQDDGSPAPFTPFGAEDNQRYIAAEKAGNVIADAPTHCYPHGVPRLTTAPYPIRFVHTPGLIVMLHEVAHNVRYVHMDGKAPPKDTPNTFLGYSTGRWDGNTLVVETTHLNTDTMLDTHIGHGPDLKVTERWTKIKNKLGNTILRDVITIEDPQRFTRAWNTTKDFAYRADVMNTLWSEGLVEYSCEENNRNTPDANGISTAK
jgi:hypothetical protein